MQTQTRKHTHILDRDSLDSLQQDECVLKLLSWGCLIILHQNKTYSI